MRVKRMGLQVQGQGLGWKQTRVPYHRVPYHNVHPQGQVRS